MWNPRGDELFYLRGDALSAPFRMMVAGVRTSPALTVEHPHVLFEISTGDFNCYPVRCYEVAPDDQRFFTTALLAPLSGNAPTVTHIHLVQNWIEELKSKVPTR